MNETLNMSLFEPTQNTQTEKLTREKLQCKNTSMRRDYSKYILGAVVFSPRWCPNFLKIFTYFLHVVIKAV